MTSVVEYEVYDRVALITIRRPDKLNAMNQDVVDGLEEAWLQLQHGPERCAVLTGEGSRAFSAGVDIKAKVDDMSRAVPGVGSRLDKPVIAAVTGHCVGGGYVLVQHCDLAIATESASFTYPEAKLGVFGGIGSAAAMRIPHKVAMELLLLGGPIDALRAFDIGMVNRVTQDGEHLSTALSWGHELAKTAPLVVSAVKELVGSCIGTNLVERHIATRRILNTVADSEDRAEGLAAARERREPDFRGV